MKTRGLLKSSLLKSIILLATLAINNTKEAFRFAQDNDPANEQRLVGKYMYGGFRSRNLQAIYTPRHKPFKGYMRERRRSSFNKNR